MGSSFIDIPIKLFMPSSFDNIKEFAFKTAPAASKIEIKRFLESMYGLEVDKVRTLNMQGKKKRRGSRLIARPNYKKAYVILKNPLLLASDLFPASAIEEETKSMTKQSSINKGGERKALQLGSNPTRISRLNLKSNLIMKAKLTFVPLGQWEVNPITYTIV